MYAQPVLRTKLTHALKPPVSPVNPKPPRLPRRPLVPRHILDAALLRDPGRGKLGHNHGRHCGSITDTDLHDAFYQGLALHMPVLALQNNAQHARQFLRTSPSDHPKNARIQ